MSNEMEKRAESQSACDPAFTRGQFIKMLVERAKLAGALVLIPTIADSFVAPPAIATTTGDGNVAFTIKNNLPPIA
jgi:hypothetical protein